MQVIKQRLCKRTISAHRDLLEVTALLAITNEGSSGTMPKFFDARMVEVTHIIRVNATQPYPAVPFNAELSSDMTTGGVPPSIALAVSQRVQELVEGYQIIELDRVGGPEPTLAKIQQLPRCFIWHHHVSDFNSRLSAHDFAQCMKSFDLTAQHAVVAADPKKIVRLCISAIYGDHQGMYIPLQDRAVREPSQQRAVSVDVYSDSGIAWA